MATSTNSRWLGKHKCDFCSDKLIDKILYDARTIYGFWAVMCEEHFSLFSLKKLGTGYGQKYVKQTDPIGFFKVEG